MRAFVLAAFGFGLLPACAASIEPTRLPVEEAQEWLRYVVPLPQRIDIRGSVDVESGCVAVSGPGVLDPVAQQALEELATCVGVHDSLDEPATFTLWLQLGGAEAKVLDALPIRGQAYRIFPEPGYAGLRIVARTPVGLLYGVKTLTQLITARSTERGLTIPILRVTDWPDMEERGFWGADSFLHLRRLGSLKMNVVEQIAAVSLDANGRGRGSMKPGREVMLDEGLRYGINPVPAVVHLEQLEGKGLFDAYPELRAQGGGEGAICYSQPAIVEVLADWIAELGSLPGVSDVDVWMAENLHGQGGCRCDRCGPHDRNVLEVRAILAAWREAAQLVPGVGLRVLLTEETYGSNAAILAEIPPGVKVIYYHSLLTYTARRRPMIESLFEQHARQGRWLGVSPQLTGHVGRATPFTGAEFVRYRMQEFVEKGVSGFTAYVTPTLGHAWFNVEAAAEWSWNASGRTSSEFALSFATRHDMPDPEAFANWSNTIGPVAWDLYGSEWPAGELRNSSTPAVQALREGTLPELGSVRWGLYPHPWGQFESEAQLRDALDAAERAVALARAMGQPELLHESLVIEGYARALLALRDLSPLVGPEGIADGREADAARGFDAYIAGCDQAARSLREWAHLVAPDVDASPGARYWQLAEALERSASDMGSLAASFGVRQ